MTPPVVQANEGETVSLKVQLTSEPASTATVEFQPLVPTHASVDRTSLTFTPSDWDEPQTVVLTLVEEDPDAIDEFDTIGFFVTIGGTRTPFSSVVDLYITDNDKTTGVVIVPRPLTVTEGDSSTYTVRLLSQPGFTETPGERETVTVAITGHTGTDLTLDETSLVFTALDWRNPQTVTVSAAEDNDGVNDHVRLVHTTSSDDPDSDYRSLKANLIVTVTDNDAPGRLLFSPAAVAVAEGGSSSYTVRLSSQPTGTVTVAITGHAGTDLTPNKTSLTFTTTTWNTVQTVTVSAVTDADTVSEAVTLVHTASGANYDAVTANVPVTISDTTTTNSIPVFPASAAARSVPENTAAGTNIGAAVAASDADAGDTLSYTLGGTDAASFDIVASSGQLRTKTGVTYDHEAKASYTVTVTADDGEGGTAMVTVAISVTDVNEPPAAPAAPTVAAASRTSLSVSWTAPTNTGKPAISDYDLQYRKGTDSYTDWAHSGTGTSATITGLDPGTSYDVQVKAKNAEGESGWSPAGSATTTANNAPDFGATTATRSVPENTAAGEDIGAAVVATDADTSDTLTYTLGGADAASFDIVSTSGQLRTKSGVTYDHETKASYAVTVSAEDDHEATDSIAVTISVTDVNEPPAAPAAPTVAAASRTSLSVSWTAPTNTGPAISSYDLRYRAGTSGDWTNGPQDVSGTSSTITGLAFGTSYQVQVRATNAEGDSGWSASGSSSTTANSAPTFPGTTAARSVSENSAVGTSVGAAVAATDADAGDTLTYTLGGTDAASFDIVASSGQLRTKTGVTYDHEAKATYTVTVSAADGEGGTDTVTVTISVTDVNEPPAAPAAPTVAAASRTSLSVSWTAPTNTGKPAISDYDVQYRKGTDSYTDWAHSGTGTSATITGLDPGTSYDVQVKAKNAEGESGWSPAGSATTTANNAPDFGATTATRSVPENTAAGEDIGAAVAATDADTSDTLTYTLGGTDAASFDIVSTSGQLRTKPGVTYDHETKASYAVTVSAEDDHEATDSIAVTISVTDVNEPPAAPAAPTVAAASRTSLSVSWTAPTNTGKPAISDYDVQYRKGTDNYAAWTHAGTATSTTITGLDPGTSYDVQVKAKNAEGDSAWSPAGSGSTTVNNAPDFGAAAATRSVAENTAAGTNLGAAFAATDADMGDTLTYTLGGADAASFDIVATTGQLKTKSGVTYNYEAKTSYAVTVSAEDDLGARDSIAVTISVTDVNEPPAAPAAPAVASAGRTSLSVTWSAPANTGPAISSYDLRYRAGSSGNWTDGPQDVTGTSSTITGLAFGTSYQVQVRATNAEGDGDWSASGSGTTTANSAPTFPGTTATRSVPENTAAGTDIGAAVAATDADAGDTLTYTLGGTDSASFDIVSTSGQLRTKSAVTYDHEAKATYTVTVTAADGEGGTATVTVTISVTDENEPPAAPAAPTVAAASRTSLSVSWTAPTNTGKPAISDYDVQYRTGTDSYAAWAHTGTSTSATITGLDPGMSYDVQVKAKNAEGESGWSAAGSATTTANTAPDFGATTATRSVPENTAAGTNIGAAVAATDADTSDTLTYTVGGTDAASFDIVSTSGQLRTKSGVTYDHEAEDSYAVTVSAEDDHGATDSIAVTISVTDVDEPPAAPAAPTVAAASRTSLSVSWTAPANTGKPAISDYDVQYRTGTASYAAWAHTGTATSATITGLDAGTSYDVQVKAKNAEGESGWSAAGSGSPTANSAPDFGAATLTRSVAENTPAGTNIGAAVVASDADAGDTLTYTLGGMDAASFDIVATSGQLRTKSAVSYDHEAKASYALTVSAEDDHGATDSIAVTVSVTDVDEPPAAPAAPTVTGASLTSLSVSWTAPTNTGKPAISDYDVQYRTGTAGYAAWAHTGTATSATITGLDAGTSYDVQVKAKNAEGESGWSAAGSGSPTANSAPDFGAATLTRSVAENTPAGTNIGAAVAASDADAGDTLTYTLGGADAASFDIVATSGQLRTRSAVSYDHEAKASYALTVSAEDDHGATDSIAVTVSVTDVDEPPAAPDAPTVTGASLTSLSVSWTAPANTGKPAISDYDVQYRTGTASYAAWAHTGTATSATITGLDAGTSYDVQVKAKNAEGESGWSAAGSGSPTANSAPDFGAATATRSVAENTPAGTNIGAAVAASDADAGDTLTYTLGGADAASFDIVATSGQLRTKGAVSYDHEAKASYALTVSAEDDAGATDSIAVTISVTDVDEPPAAPGAPTVTGASLTSLSVSWTAPANTGKPAISDYDVQYRAGTASYAAWAHAGTATSATITGLDAGTSYDVQVKAKNAEGESGWSAAGSGSPTANSAPDFGAATLTRSVAENTPAGTNIGAAVAASDADAGDTLTYTLGGADAASFDIVATSGQLRTKGAVSYDHEAKASYALTVSAEDDAGATDSIAVTISVTDVDEPPAAPGAPTVTGASLTSLSVSWTAPANTGKPAISDYDVQYRAGTASYAAWAHAGTATSATITGLDAGTSYDVQVKAKNAEGESGWSAAGSDSPTAIPTDLGFGLADATAIEGQQVVFSLTRDSAGEAISATWVAMEDPQAENPATDGEDFVGASGTINFELDQARATFSVETMSDRRSEPRESFRAEVLVAGATLSAVGTIQDPARPAQRIVSEPGMWLWTDELAYLPGDSMQLYLNIEPNGQEDDYAVFIYRVELETGARVWLNLRSDPARFEPEAGDIYGHFKKELWARRLMRVDNEMKWEGPVPAAGHWQFVAELRSASGAQVLKRAYASFLVAEAGTVLVAKRGFERRLRTDQHWTSDAIRILGGRLVVPRGVTLEIEAGTQVRAWGPGTAIVVEAGGRIIARGRREKPIVMTCASSIGLREAGCWGGLQITGGAVPEGPAIEDSKDAGGEPGLSTREDSSGELRYVRVEFAGSAPDGAAAAVSLHQVGAGTVLENVQAHASLGQGFRFQGGTVGCHRCVASNARQAGVFWEGGFQGLLQDLYVQQADRSSPALWGTGGPEVAPGPSLYNATLVGSGYSAGRDRGSAVLLDGTAAIHARNVIATGFRGYGIEARARAAENFTTGVSSVGNLVFGLNDRGAANPLTARFVEDRRRGPQLLNVRLEPNPDPRPHSGSEALVPEHAAVPPFASPSYRLARYVGAFGSENWLEQWTWFGREEQYRATE